MGGVGGPTDSLSFSSGVSHGVPNPQKGESRRRAVPYGSWLAFRPPTSIGAPGTPVGTTAIGLLWEQTKVEPGDGGMYFFHPPHLRQEIPIIHPLQVDVLGTPSMASTRRT